MNEFSSAVKSYLKCCLQDKLSISILTNDMYRYVMYTYNGSDKHAHDDMITHVCFYRNLYIKGSIWTEIWMIWMFGEGGRSNVAGDLQPALQCLASLRGALS